jgi:hypothetical protein
VLLRRYFLVAFAPVRPRGFTGKILAASYDLLTRQTTIVFQSSEGQMSAQYNHDSSRVSQPVPSAVNTPAPVIPKITLRLEGQLLAAHDARRKLSTLMTVPPRAALHIVYPSPVHPDLTAIWSIDNQIYYTNNDYKNVYLLPATMREPQEKPRIVP